MSEQTSEALRAWFRRVVVVILTAVVIAVIIALLDIVIKYGVNLLVAL